MPTSWGVIKAEIAKRKRKGSTGYLVELLHAADLFVALRGKLKDQAEAESEFNTDDEVRLAIVNRVTFVNLGLIKQSIKEGG